MTGLLRCLVLAALLVLPVAAPAVQPDEVLPDPALESRAREVSEGLRCLVCRNENIDESNADLARDMRLLVRERIVEGDSNDEVVDFIVDRYGEYVLLNPTTRGSNLILWLAGPAMFLLAAGIGWGYLRARETAEVEVAPDLNPDEQARLKKILDE